MAEQERGAAFRQVAQVLPRGLRQGVLEVPQAGQERAEEIRLRVGRPVSVVFPEGERSLTGPPVEERDLEQLVEIASQASLHAVLPQIRQGYLTVAGGHRIGLCGTANLRDGGVHSLSPLSSANLRIARQIRGASDPILGQICPEGRLESTLILAPPGLGKTTLLRDVVRRVSEGEGCQPMRVSLADERGELAALWGGIPQLDVGRRTDVLENCPKAQGLMLLLRAMNPQVLAVDEITAAEDVAALRQAVGCGVTLLATAHGRDRADLHRRVLYRPLLEEGLIRRLVTIHCRDGQRNYTVEELE